MAEKKPGVIVVDSRHTDQLSPEFKKRLGNAFADALLGAMGYQRVNKDTSDDKKLPA